MLRAFCYGMMTMAPDAYNLSPRGRGDRSATLARDPEPERLGTRGGDPPRRGAIRLERLAKRPRGGAHLVDRQPRLLAQGREVEVVPHH